MKRTLLILVPCLAVLAALTMGNITRRPSRVSGRQISTNQFSYDLARTVTTNDSALTDSTKDWASIGSVFHAMSPAWSNVSISFYAYGDGTGAGSPDGGTFDFSVYVARRYGGAQLVCSQNDATVGAMQLSHNPSTGDALDDGTADSNYCWVDTTAVSTDWQTTVAEGNDDGADEQAELSFDVLGTYGIYVIVNDMTNVTSVTYVITGFGG